MIEQIDAGLAKLQRDPFYRYSFLVAVLLLAAALRFYKLGEWSFWIEEHHSLRHARALGSWQRVFSTIRPLFYLLLRPVLKLLGEGEWAARLVPTLFGLITIPICFWIVKRIFGSALAFLVVLLLAVSPWHIYWSQNARFYSLLLLLYTVSLFTFYWGLEEGQFKYIGASVITLVLAGATHGLAALLIPIYFLYFILLKVLRFEKPRSLRLRYLLPFIVLPFAGYLVIEVYRVFFVGTDSIFSIIYTRFFNESTASFIGYSGPYIMLTAVVYYIGTPLAALSLIGSIYLLLKKKRVGLLLALGAYFPLGLMMVLTLFASTANRYVFMTLPCWIILGAVGVKVLYSQIREHKGFLVVGCLLGILLALLRDPVIEDVLHYTEQDKLVGLLIVLGFIVCFFGLFWFFRLATTAKSKHLLPGVAILTLLLLHPLVTDGLYYAYQHGHRDNWKAVAAAINQRKVTGDTIVSSVTPLAAYYLNQDVKNVRTIDWNEAMQNNRRVWVVESFGTEQVMNGALEKWTKANCDSIGIWDQYTAGRNWKMRVFLCESADSHAFED